MVNGRSSKGKRGYGVSVAVVYPGSPAEGMASLAVHALLRQVAEFPGSAGERIFIADRKQTRPKSVEASRPASDFDLLAFSVSFEEQWVLLPDLLQRAGIPPRRRDRNETHPIVLVGGMAARLNPCPVLPFVDLVVPGEAECVMPGILTILEAGKGKSRSALLADLGDIAGVFIHGQGTHMPACLVQQCDPVAQEQVLPESVFGDMFLVETGRGCPAACRFCAVAFSRRPPLFHSAEKVVQAASAGIAAGKKIGLVGASLSMHPQLLQMVEAFASEGADLSPASLHPDVLAGEDGERLLSQLCRSGQRTLTLAPETGSVRLGKLVNKPLNDEIMECAVRRLGEAGVIHLKLYLMYGLPTEQEDDLEDTVSLVREINRWLVDAQRPTGRAGRLSVSLNPFVPKPHTPLGWEPMPVLSELKRRFALLVGGMRKAGASSVTGMSPRHAVLQCLLDRSGEEIADLLEKTGGRWPPPSGLLKQMVPQLDELVHRPWPKESEPPWQVVDVGVKSKALVSELLLAKSHIATKPCDAEVCEACGACSGLT